MESLAAEVQEFATQYLSGLKHCLDSLDLSKIAAIVRLLHEAYTEGRNIFIIGNGGSAATASHMACDLGRPIPAEPGTRTTKRLRVTTLTDNMPLVTAWANDVGYDAVFAEQLRGAVDEGDVLIAISGSGNSANIIKAVRLATAMGAKTIGILGFDGGIVRELVDEYIVVDSDDYGYIEDVHLVLNHLIAAHFRRLIGREAGDLSGP